MAIIYLFRDNKNLDSPYFVDNLNTPDNMSKNNHTKLFKSQFSAASGNKTNYTTKLPFGGREKISAACFYI